MDTHRILSALHIASSILALVLGAWVLIVHKGDRRHRRMGRAYAISMLLVNATAFGIYRLFGGFGPFHVAAVISLLTLIAGMRPVLLRERPNDWYTTHMIFMYWSVVGLYAAFASELLVRLPERPGAYFGLLVGGSTAAIMAAAGYFQGRLVKRWSAEVGARH
jgi:uncharacterized membrane protein